MSENLSKKDSAALAVGPALHIDGVPPRMSRLSPGMMYAITVDQQTLRIALIAQSLLAGLQSGVQCTLVTALDPKMFLKKCGLVGAHLNRFLETGQLRLYRQRNDAGAEVTPMSAKWLLNDLKQYKLPGMSMVFLDSAEDRFCLSDPASAASLAATYQEWVFENRHTVMALFVPRVNAQKEFGTLRTVAEHFGGFGVIKTTDEQAVLDVRHWFGLLGATPRSSYLLSIDTQGRLRARPVAMGGRLAMDPADERQIITRTAAQGFNIRNNRWDVVENFVEAIDRSRQVEGGTVVLDFDKGTDIRELAQTVATVRSLGRSQLRVLIRECGARLRIGQIVALMRLGAGLVIPKELSGSGARLVAESLRGSVSARSFETHVDQVFLDSQVDSRVGFMGISEFRLAVDRLLGISEDVEIPVTLIRFSMASAQALRAASGALQRGARDTVFTEYDNCIWALLFGCGVEHAEVVLSRLLGARFERLMTGWQRFGSTLDITQAMRLLDHAVTGPSDAVFSDTVVRFDNDGDNVIGIGLKSA